MAKVEAKVVRAGGKQRRGRGFSLEEIRKAGSNSKEALRLGIPADFRRRTAHEDNIETLKGFLANVRASRKATVKPKVKTKK
jgi:ribosomal protein L13E